MQSTYKIEARINNFARFLNTNAGAMLCILVMCFILVIFTTKFFGAVLAASGFGVAGYLMGAGFAFIFEFIPFVLAVRGKYILSGAFALASYLIARATFQGYLNTLEADTLQAGLLDANFVAGHVLGIVPSFLVGYFSHQIAQNVKPLHAEYQTVMDNYPTITSQSPSNTSQYTEKQAAFLEKYQGVVADLKAGKGIGETAKSNGVSHSTVQNVKRTLALVNA